MIDIEYYTSEATTLLNSLIGIPSLTFCRTILKKQVS